MFPENLGPIFTPSQNLWYTVSFLNVVHHEATEMLTVLLHGVTNIAVARHLSQNCYH
jgi:hypothetical protein